MSGQGRKDEDRQFEAFLRTRAVEPPRELSSSVRARIQPLLNPPVWLVLIKLAFVQAGIGWLTLAACPQFGVGLSWGLHHGIFHWLNAISEELCMAACGAFFLGMSALAASFVLSFDELRVMKRWRLLVFPAIGGASLLAFHFQGGEVVGELAVFWLPSAVAAALLAMETGRRLRFGVSAARV